MLYQNIVLSGGSTLFRGFGDRLLSELKKSVSKDMKIRVCGHSLLNYSICCTLQSSRRSLHRKSDFTLRGWAAPFLPRWTRSRKCGYPKRSTTRTVIGPFTARHSSGRQHRLKLALAHRSDSKHTKTRNLQPSANALLERVQQCEVCGGWFLRGVLVVFLERCTTHRHTLYCNTPFICTQHSLQTQENTYLIIIKIHVM